MKIHSTDDEEPIKKKLAEIPEKHHDSPGLFNDGYYDDMLNTEDRVHHEQQLREEEKRQEND